MSHQNTKKHILDAAEKLFALHGFSETSLREITSEAGVNLAAVNYHFGSKESLLDAVMERRITPLNQSRLRLLQKVEDGKQPATIRNIISCFIRPPLEMLKSGPQQRYFILLTGRIMSEINGPQIEIFHRHMLPILPPFFNAFKRIKPHLEMNVITWGMHFSIGVLTHNIRMYCNIQMPQLENMAIDIELLGEMIINFITSGLETTYA